MEKDKQRIPSVDLFKYFCAILVIAIHTRPLEEINPLLGFAASDVVTRIAVPFFFTAFGYFYFQKRINGEKAFMRSFQRLLMVYSLWSMVYFLIIFFQWGYTNIKGYLVDCVLGFFLYGSYYHFWFFPALLFALCICELFLRLGWSRLLIPLSIVLFATGCLGCSYYSLCKDLPFLGSLFSHSQFNTIRRMILMGFPFFAGGYVVHLVKDRCSSRAWNIAWACVFLAWIGEIIFVSRKGFQRNVILTFALYPYTLLTLIELLLHPAPKLGQFTKDLKKISGLTYYAHPLFILFLSAAYRAVADQAIPNTLLFTLTVFSTMFVGKLFCRINKPFLNRLMS